MRPAPLRRWFKRGTWLRLREPWRRIQGENMLTGALRSLFALAEAYPDLKANANFMDLQAQLQRVEEDIARARTNYNAT